MNETTALAITDQGKELDRTESEVKAAMQFLVLNGGKLKRTEKDLAAEGLEIPWSTLRHWKERTFKKLYFATRKELARDIGEEVAGRAMERALQADEVEAKYLKAASKKVGLVEPNHLARSALALSQAKGQNIEKAALLRHEPTQRLEVDVRASIAILERLKVVESIDDQRPSG